jgi:hypothetical protein
LDKFSEARGIAKGLLGNGAIVTSAVPGRMYSGKILGTAGEWPDKAVIQAISDNHAILHDIRETSEKSNIRLGEDMTLTADEHGYSVIKNTNAEKTELAREGVRR